MTTEWDANLQAINVILDRDSAEIARLTEQYRVLANHGTQLEAMLRGQIADLEAKLIERLAEINEKDRRIAELEETIRCMQPLRGLHI